MVVAPRPDFAQQRTIRVEYIRYGLRGCLSRKRNELQAKQNHCLPIILTLYPALSSPGGADQIMKTPSPFMPTQDPGVPGKKHYAIDTPYLRGGRIHSYAHQIEAVIEQSPARVLEIGKGPGIVTAALRAAGIRVVTLDTQTELESDLVGCVTSIPAAAGSFDVSLCCQVLEHLPFTQFPDALQELCRVTRNALVMSLPDITPHYYIDVQLPRLRLNWHFSRSILLRPWRPLSVAFEHDGHFWEIGYRGSTLHDVTTSLKKSGWNLIRTWRVPEKAWHRFFLATPQNAASQDLIAMS